MIKPRIAIVVSHPIQHFCPMYASWAANSEWELKVFFASSTGAKKYFDPNFKKEINWNRLYLDKFKHEFLNEVKVLELNKSIDAPELDDKLKEFNPDIVISYGYTQKLQLRAKKWAIQNNKKIFMISDAELRHYRPWYIRAIKKVIIPFKLKGFDGFLTVGDANEEYYMLYGVPKEKFFRFPFPIDIFLYEEAKKTKDELRRKIRSQFKISDDDIVLSNVGKFVDWKRQIDIIKAMKSLENISGRLFLFLIGSGQQESKLQQETETLKRHKVIFTGFVAPEELPAYYAATDIYVHPAEKEPHSLAISEAIYMGCPVIISDRCGSYGPTDDVQPHINGIVYKTGSINSLTESILKLFSNKELRKNFSNNSFKIGSESQVLAHSISLKKYF